MSVVSGNFLQKPKVALSEKERECLDNIRILEEEKDGWAALINFLKKEIQNEKNALEECFYAQLLNLFETTPSPRPSGRLRKILIEVKTLPPSPKRIPLLLLVRSFLAQFQKYLAVWPTMEEAQDNFNLETNRSRDFSSLENRYLQTLRLLEAEQSGGMGSFEMFLRRQEEELRSRYPEFFAQALLSCERLSKMRVSEYYQQMVGLMRSEPRHSAKLQSLNALVLRYVTYASRIGESTV